MVDGAKVECKEGTKSATLKGSEKNIDAGGKAALTTSDKQFVEKNFKICKKLTKKAEKKAKKEGKPKPDPVKCKPEIEGKWTGADSTTQVGGEDALSMNCKLTCKEAGKKDTISIISDGQGSGSADESDLTDAKIYCMRYRAPNGKMVEKWYGLDNNGQPITDSDLLKKLAKEGRSYAIVSYEEMKNIEMKLQMNGISIMFPTQNNLTGSALKVQKGSAHFAYAWENGLGDILTALSMGHTLNKANSGGSNKGTGGKKASGADIPKNSKNSA